MTGALRAFRDDSMLRLRPVLSQGLRSIAARRSRSSTLRLPNFLIIGAMKSGTTSLFSWLGDHPDVYLPPEKEVRFFDDHYYRGVEWYGSRFAAATTESALGEATPLYLFRRDAHARMAAVVPDAKLIVMLRNPVDRAYSHYWHWVRRMGETRTFEQAVEDEFRRGGVPDGNAPAVANYLAPGRYVEQLEHLSQHFAREQQLVIWFEDLKQRPVATFQQTCEFVGINPSIVPATVGKAENSNLYYRPMWLWRILVLIRIGNYVPARVGAAIWRAMIREGEPYPPMPLELRLRLIEHFAPHNADLERWLGCDLSHWSRLPA